MLTPRWLALTIAFILLAPASSSAGSREKHDGYAEWREGRALVVDGQRVRPAPRVKFKGKGDARDFDSIPLGYEVKVEGERLEDGTILATKVEAKPNGTALFEPDLEQAFDQMEKEYLRQGRMFQEDAQGRTRTVGELYDEGPQVERVRRIASRLTPPYLSSRDFRIYVVNNREWNAMAAPNRSIYVFSGLLEDMDDDEVAIVLGHELVHSTHEHSRRNFKKAMLVQIGAVGAMVATDSVDSTAKRTAIQLATMLTSSALVSGYGRNYEDQADRVGLRYAWEGGFDVRKGPRLWQRFADKYGDGDKVTNFFFSDHSIARDRERNLEREIALNYSPVSRGRGR